MKREPHVARDLGRKVSEQLQRDSMDAILLLHHPEDHALFLQLVVQAAIAHAAAQAIATSDPLMRLKGADDIAFGYRVMHRLRAEQAVAEPGTVRPAKEEVVALGAEMRELIFRYIAGQPDQPGKIAIATGAILSALAGASGVFAAVAGKAPGDFDVFALGHQILDTVQKKRAEPKADAGVSS